MVQYLQRVRHVSLPLLILLLIISSSLSACSGESAGSDTQDVEMAALDQMPPEVQEAPVSVRQAYQFAAANPEVMEGVPCYCGCGAMGHTSSYSCYISGAGSDGQLQYDTHALGCSICVDITQDTMRLLVQGQTTSQIKAYVDQTYAQFGPSNMP